MRRSTAVNPWVVIQQKITPRWLHAVEYVDYDGASQDAAIGCIMATISAINAREQPTFHVGHDNIPMMIKMGTGVEINMLPSIAFDAVVRQETHNTR